MALADRPNCDNYAIVPWLSTKNLPMHGEGGWGEATVITSETIICTIGYSVKRKLARQCAFAHCRFS